MIYTIVHDTPGRLRVRVGQWVLNQQECAALASYLRRLDGVLDAQVRPANGSILMCYQLGYRSQCIRTLDALDLRSLPGDADDATPDMGALTNTFQITSSKR